MNKQNIDPVLIMVILILVGLGLVMVLSASSVHALSRYGDSYYFLKRQFGWAALGLLAMFILSRLDYHIYSRYAKIMLLVAVALLIIVLIPDIGRLVGGSRRWLWIGPLVIQPSEIAKLALVVYMATYIVEKKDRFGSFFNGLLPPLFLLGIVFVLIIEEPDLGTAITIAGTVILMLFAAGARLSHLGFLAMASMPLLYYFVMGEDYRRERMLAFLDPWQDPMVTGFHIIQSLFALGSGGLFGLGFGQSKQKFFYLPAPSTDFIFAVIGEELGFIGAFLVVALFFILAWRGFVIALNARDLLGTLLATGITTMIILQALINMAVVSGSIPITGISLPFISYGGSSLVIMLSGVGILMNISRQARI